MKWDVQNLASTPHFIRLFSTYPQDAISAAYKALGLKNNANLTEVKAAYRRLALKCHPDLHPKGATEFLRVKAAYEAITNPASRTFVHSHRPQRTTGIRTHAGRRHIHLSDALTFWGLGLATSCLLVGTMLYWGRIGSHNPMGSHQKRPSRVIEAQQNAVTKKQIAALLIHKTKQKNDKK
ncbi:hypothetical protein KC19_1G127700 [Ceratodon purpureus]|uniref:J domain-containing protein n=1 Tax=Ceratodon purpureus TaxID=3225 RepID=A0A8T0J4G9_CERPU|nr:hypothetical protein KC19_1G127700 [Ceratodon purpureus]